jgi:uncharacterized protein (TIGR00725 family)
MYHSKTIAVIGARDCDEELYHKTEKLGNLLAKRGYRIICGGLGGIMEAVCKGAKTAGGDTIGVLPGDDPAAANPYIDTVIVTGMGISRNLIIVRSAIGVIAVDGGYGTLSELAFALQLKKPIVGMGTWKVSEKIAAVESPREAVDLISKMIKEVIE